MNKLSNPVIDFAARRKARQCLLAPGASRPRRSAGLLVCRWQRDPATVRLLGTWSPQMAEYDFDANPRLRAAS